MLNGLAPWDLPMTPGLLPGLCKVFLCQVQLGLLV